MFKKCKKITGGKSIYTYWLRLTEKQTSETVTTVLWRHAIKTWCNPQKVQGLVLPCRGPVETEKNCPQHCSFCEFIWHHYLVMIKPPPLQHIGWSHPQQWGCDRLRSATLSHATAKKPIQVDQIVFVFKLPSHLSFAVENGHWISLY